LLEEILEEEKDADETLTQIAREINWEAAEEDEDEDEYDEEEEEEETEEEDDDDNEDDDEDTRDQLSELDAIQS
jgi:hypothetical protein